ncbi:NAD(+) synthase, partial [Myxococcota bacterium]|nr:NAD(+) synthase [Myxococcota bacterium]
MIGLYSFDPFPGDIEKNGARMVEVISQAREKGVELLVFPEMSLPGYCIGDLHASARFIARQNAVLHNVIIPATRGITVIIGKTVTDEACRMPDGQVGRFNGYAVISNGKLLREGKKTLLANEGVLEDSRYFLLGTPEELIPTEVEIPGKGTLRVGILVCQDMWDDYTDIRPATILKEKGADLLVVINSSPFHIKKDQIRKETAIRRARETGLPLYYTNNTGIQDIGKNIVIFDGSSFAVSGDGNLKQAAPFEEELLLCPFRSGWAMDNLPDFWSDYSVLMLLEKSLVFSIRQFYQRTGVFSGAVIGLSGGIDSAVDAVLTARAIGPENLLCVNMPSQFNSATTRSIAQSIAENLGCRYIIHPIDEIIATKVAALTAQLGHEPTELTVENMQARARGSILMEYSQEFNLMVVGNGNKTEFQRGYATLYGDILGAIMPLGDVPKLSVYELAKRMDPRGEIISAELLYLIPSAELSARQNVDQGHGDPFDYFMES